MDDSVSGENNSVMDGYHDNLNRSRLMDVGSNPGICSLKLSRLLALNNYTAFIAIAFYTKYDQL